MHSQNLGFHAMTDSQDMKVVIRSILQKLIAEYAPQKVVLFGSYAYGVPGRDSDIDLLIIKETSERFIDRWATVQRILLRILSKSSVQRPMENDRNTSAPLK